MIRINVANQRELTEIPGLRPEDAEAIVRFRDEHGPVTDAARLAAVLGGRDLDEATLRQIDFDPANQTAPEAPGA
jgi:DNA uptake protein ComE-like DNA-binding protein